MKKLIYKQRGLQTIQNYDNMLHFYNFYELSPEASSTLLA
jgi:hypothetical protein